MANSPVAASLTTQLVRRAMEKMMNSRSQISQIWMDFDKVTAYLYPSTELIYGVSLFVTLLAIFLAWRYTKRRNSGSSRECNVPNDSCASEEKVFEDSFEKEQNVMNADRSKADHGLKHHHGVTDPSNQIKIPKGCPMAHMFDLAKMSKLIADDNQEESAKDEETEGEEDDIDPQQYMSHIQSQVKRSQQRVTLKKIEEEMSAEQKAKEREIQRQQLESIFKMMEEHKEKFGVSDMDEMQNQVKLYM